MTQTGIAFTNEGSPAGAKGEIGLQQPVEGQQRLVVEPDVIDLVEGDPSGVETVRRRLGRKARVVLLPGESLLLGSRDDLTIPHQRGRAVVIEGRQS